MGGKIVSKHVLNNSEDAYYRKVEGELSRADSQAKLSGVVQSKSCKLGLDA